jgi:hypothetical protein
VALLACSSFDHVQKVFTAAKKDLGEILSGECLILHDMKVVRGGNERVEEMFSRVGETKKLNFNTT